jgi:putative glutamine amidotransferase
MCMNRSDPGNVTHRPTPIVGITTDVVEAAGGRQKADCALAYAQCIAQAGGGGGIPLFLPPLLELIPQQVALCSALVLTGGDDPHMEEFGHPTHSAAKPMHPQRQRYELALLRHLAVTSPHTPVLGICLGMQLIALDAGASLNQHLPDTHATAGDHRGTHEIIPVQSLPSFKLAPGAVLSHHHQAVADPGPLAVLARAHDGVIEAVADPQRRFFVGVQWHPERTDTPALGRGLFEQLLAAARPSGG